MATSWPMRAALPMQCAKASLRSHFLCSMRSVLSLNLQAKTAAGATKGSQATGSPRARSTKAGLEDQTNQQQAPAPKAEQPAVPAKDEPEAGAIKRKRLRRAVEDSPVKEAMPQAVLEDDVPGTAAEKVQNTQQPPSPPPKASPKRARTSSPTKKTAAAVSSALIADVNASLPTLNKAPSSAKAKAKVPGTTSGKVGASKVSAAPVSKAAEEEDDISFTASESGSEESGAEEGAEAQSGVKRLKRSDDTVAPSKRKRGASKGSGKAGKVDGVGSGALEAAKQACQADIPSLCTWKANEPVPYGFFADTLEDIAETSKRLEITSKLTSCFRAILSTTPEDLLPAVYMCVNKVEPDHHGVELGLGEALLVKALAHSTGRNEDSLKKDFQEAGDWGTVAVNAKSTQKPLFAPKPLTVRGVFKAFKDIAECSGSKSQEKKQAMVVKLLSASKGNETGYAVRSLLSKLRIGLAEQSVLVALAHAVLLHREGVAKGKDNVSALADQLEQAVQCVKAAYSECPSYDKLIPALLEHGLWDLGKHCHFMPSVPVKPMLAKPTVGVAEVIDKFEGKVFTSEYKYDGERAQIHVWDGGKKVMIFSRSSENMTGKYPDIAARMPGLLAPGVDSAVLDGEAVAWDPVSKKILPFQTLSTRKRKDVVIADIKVQVKVYAFDCLYLNGQSLLQEPLTKRREALYSSVMEKEGELQYAIAKTSNDIEELQVFLDESVEAATEGLIVKTMDDTYEPAKRSSHWLKLKKDYMEGVGDTIDVVVVGGFHGTGKRTGVFGAFLLAIYDSESETYQTISKIGTGFSEVQLKAIAETLRPLEVPGPRKYYTWDQAEKPDVWFDAKVVWEVKAADISISPKYKAALGLVDPNKGISIRFPRLVRIREDKGPEDTTSAEQIAEMYQNQAVVRRKKAAEADE